MEAQETKWLGIIGLISVMRISAFLNLVFSQLSFIATEKTATMCLKWSKQATFLTAQNYRAKH